MNIVTEGNHHEDLTHTDTSTVRRPEHLSTDCTKSSRQVVVSVPVPVFYLFDGFREGTSVGVFVKVEFDVTIIVERHHTYLYLV